MILRTKLLLDNLHLPEVKWIKPYFEYEVSDSFMFDLRRFLAGVEDTNFTSMLIKLMFKADGINSYALSAGYPAEMLTIACYLFIPDFHEQFKL